MSNIPTVIEVKTSDIVSKDDTLYGEPFRWSRYKALVGRRFKPHTPLEQFSDLSSTSSIEMKVNIEDHLYDVQLPAEILARLVRYLADKNYPFKKGRFDCVSFVHWMLGVPYEYGKGVDMEKFEMERLHNDWDLRPGDVIHMSAGSKYVNNSGALFI